MDYSSEPALLNHSPQQSWVKMEDSVQSHPKKGCQAVPVNKKLEPKAVLGWAKFYIRAEGDMALNSSPGLFFYTHFVYYS